MGHELYVANLGPGGPSGSSGGQGGGILGPGSVVEIDAGTGAFVRSASAGACHIDEPYGMVSSGGLVLLSNIGNGSVAELSAASGACVGATFGSSYQFDHPSAMVVAHGHLVVGGESLGATLATVSGLFSSSFGPELTEVNPSTGALTRVVGGAGYKFDRPAALASAGKDVFVANLSGASITEVDAGTGALVRVVSLGSPAEVAPTALAVWGKYLLIGSLGNNSTHSGSVSELDMATGRVVEMITGKQYKLGLPLSMAVDGRDLFVDSIDGDNSSGSETSTLTEIDLPSRHVARALSGRKAHIGEALDLLADGPYIFVVNAGALVLQGGSVAYTAGSLTQIDTKTGTVVRVISAPRYDLGGASAMAMLGQDLYVADSGANAVTEIDPATGSLVRVLSATRYGFSGPDGEAAWGNHLYVANGQGDSVTDINFGSS